MKLPPALRFLEANAWALRPEVFEALAEIVARHADGVRLDDAQVRAAMGREDDGASAEPRMEMIGTTAVVSLRGVIARYADQVNGACQPAGRSAESLIGDLDALARNPGVQAVVLRIDSPGGTVAGTAEVADAVRALSASGTPVYAFVDGMAASAAYWIASQADEIVAAGPTSAVGSIGIIAALIERQPASGTKVHVIRSAPLKAPGTAGEAIDERQRASIQQHVDDLHEAFATTVAGGRGMTVAQQAAASTGEVFASKRAQALGLIDSVEPWGAFIARIGGGASRFRAAAPVAPAARDGADAITARAEQDAEPYTTTAHAGEPAPEQPMSKMVLTAVVLAAIVAAHPEHALLAVERANAGDDEAKVRDAIAGAEKAKVEAKAKADAEANAKRVADLEAKAKADAEKITALEREKADLQTKHDALAALKTGAAAGTKIKADGDDAQVRKVTRAEFAVNPTAYAKALRTGSAVLVD